MLRLVLFFLFLAIAPNILLSQYTIVYAQENQPEVQSTSDDTDQAETNTEKPSNNDEAPKLDTEKAPSSDNKQADDAEVTNSNSNSVIIPRSEISIAEPISIFKQQQQDLQHYLPQAAISPLLAGSDDYLILLEEHITSVNKGVVILLPDWHQGAASSTEINYLRQQLPKQGWTTITVTPPNKPEHYPSYALTLTERQQDNQKSLEPYLQKLTVLMQALMSEAKEYPGIFLVIAQGSHAAMLVNTYQQPDIELPTAFVMLSAYLPTHTENTLFAENVAATELPILDIYLRRDHGLVTENAQLRKDLAKKEMKIYYRQKALHNIHPSEYPNQALLKEINGWLTSIGW